MVHPSSLIPIDRLKRWYNKGYIVPLIIPFNPKTKNPWELAKRFADQEANMFFLDSVRYQEKTGRYSYIGWNPFYIFQPHKLNGFVPELRGLFERYRGKKWDEAPFFTGGGVGYFSYEVGHAFEVLPSYAKDDLRFDPIALLFVRNLIVFDHQSNTYFFVSNLFPREDGTFSEALEKERQLFCGFANKISTNPPPGRGSPPNIRQNTRRTRRAVWRELADPPICVAEKEVGVRNYVPPSRPSPARGEGVRIRNFRADISKSAFKKMVVRTKKYLEAGDIYQANLSQRFSFEFDREPATIYESLRQINPSPFSSFLKLGEVTILSSSPERLIRKSGDICETRPIAGTRPCGVTRAEEKNFRRDLMMSPKERAEHIMLVDLERNDLGRVCQPNSVHVSELMTIEKYSHVIHIVSNVKGKLRPECDRFDLLKAVFPGGTITGCPKIRSMEIIEELEPFKRHLYTGSIGYLAYDGDMDLNIVIRTIILKGKKGYIQVGAGIVYDSDPEAEYWETIHKGKAMVEALGTCKKNE